MASSPPTPKRKRSKSPNLLTGISDALLHPGWRSKRARSGSRSGSPTDSRASSPGPDETHNSSQSSTLPHTPSPEIRTHSQTAHPTGHLTPAIRVSAPQVVAPNLPAIATGSISGPSKETSSTWTGLEKALQGLHITTKGCPPLHSAIGSLISCLHIFKEAAKPRKDYDELTSGLTAIVELLAKYSLAAASKDITDAIEKISGDIAKEIYSINTRQSRGTALRMLGSSGDQEDLVQRYQRIEQMFRKLQAEASMSTWDNTKKHLVNTRLENLGPVKLATYNSSISMDVGRRSCTENTRTQILNDSMAWSDDPNGAKVYWMNGMAGTGKTTIAFSLCKRLEEAEQLAASFFCTRTSRECSEAKRIVPTIAYQFARRWAPFRDALCGVLDRNPDVGTLHTNSQFDLLLVKPLMECKELIPGNLVIVIDALDECSDPHTVEIVLDILFRYAANLPVKFFVTSRPEPTIRNSMMLGIAECNRQHSILYLHEIEKSLVQADIELYLKDELKHMLPMHCNEIKELAEQAGNLFIYAATAVRYIQDRKAVNQRQRLKTILEVDKRSKKSTFDIDVLYSTILSAAIHDATLESGEQACIRVVLRTSICAYEPILISTLAALSGLDETHLAASALEPLRSVLHVSEHNSFVTTLHASFPDFMFSQERSQEYFCDRTVHDQFLAARCLKIMRAQLRFNICDLESSFALDNEIPNLDDQVKAHVSPELCYTGRFWVDHLTQGAATEELLNAVQDFLSYRLLFWMEVMNLTKCMIAASLAATKVHVWLRSSSASSDLVALARDAQIFVGKYASHPVSTSTPHIYISALPLISPKNLIRSTYMPRFKGLVKATGRYMDQTEEALAACWRVKFTSQLRSVSFSSDSRHVVAGDNSGRIRVTNVQDAQAIVDFKAHRKAISSVVFSPNGDLVASSSHDHTVCLWKVSDGSRAFAPFTGHSGPVNSVTFSSDGMRMVSGSEDATIRIWSTHSPSNSKIMTGSGAIRSVVFSPDNLLVASGSSDHNVYLWDSLNGTLLRTFLGHSDSVGCVRFSPCGKYIFSGSNDRTIRSWCVHDGTPAGNPIKGHTGHVTSLAVSPEGERIASGSLDKTVRVWHRASGELMAGPFEEHVSPVRSVEFSVDGARIISASDDADVNFWNAQGKTKDVTMPSPLDNTYTSKIECATISPAGECVAYGHSDGTITLWKLVDDGVKLVWALPDPTKAEVRCIVFSTDLDQIFVAYANGTMCTVGAGTGRFVGKPCCYSTRNYGLEMVRLSSDGRSAVSAWNSKNEIDIRDLQSNRLVRTIGSEDSKFVDIKLQSNTAWFATVNSKGKINLWDRFTGHPLSSLSCQGVIEGVCLCVSPDGTRIFYSSAEGRFSVYDTLRGIHTELKLSYLSKCYIEAVLPNEIYLFTTLFNSHTRLILYDSRIGSIINEVDLLEHPSSITTSLSLVNNKTALVSLSYSGVCQVFWFGVVRTPWESRSPGRWLLDKSGHKMICEPPEIRYKILVDGECGITGEGCLVLRCDNMLFGERWKECYLRPVDESGD